MQSGDASSAPFGAEGTHHSSEADADRVEEIVRSKDLEAQGKDYLFSSTSRAAR